MERDIKKQEQEYIATKKEEYLNTLKKTRMQYNNLCTSKEEAAMARTRYHYYEFGNKTSKLLAWQIKKETSDKFIHSILTEDGRLLDNSPSINAEFKQFYKNLYKTGQDPDNIGAKRFMDGITLPNYKMRIEICLMQIYQKWRYSKPLILYKITRLPGQTASLSSIIRLFQKIY